MIKRIDVVYSVCGRSRIQEFVRSLTSLLLFTALPRPDPQLHLHCHILSDNAAAVRSELPRPNTVQYHFHKPDEKAAALFAPCSTQRLYLHTHPGFKGIDQVQCKWHLPVCLAGGVTD